MKVLSVVMFLALLCPPPAFAAKCKVDGQWFPYDSPECNPDRIQQNGEAEQIDDGLEPPLPDTPAYSLPVRVPAYASPWREVFHEVEQRCGKYKSQPLGPANCRSREETSYWAMKSNFGLPEHIALEAKANCAEKFRSFVRQSSCTHSEATGYFLLTLDYAMPANYRSKAKAKCLRDHSSFADRGRCMVSEETVFAEKYGHQFYEPKKVGRAWTNPKQPLVASRSGFSSGPTWTEFVGQFEVDPEQFAPAELAMNQSDPPFSLPLTTVGIQLGVLSSDTPLGGIPTDRFHALVKTMDESTDRFSLSLEKPEVENRGFLELVKPSTVDPRRGAFFTPGSAGQVVLHLSVEQGRTYFIDFKVNSWKKARYRIIAESSEQVYEYSQEKCCHVLAKVIANSLGWTQLTLIQDAGLGFYFHAVDVTFTPRSEWTPESVPADGS